MWSILHWILHGYIAFDPPLSSVITITIANICICFTIRKIIYMKYLSIGTT